ncbi:hypothetical protein ACHHV8_02380 [Paenibacillus sp. TAB 01]|uniref:hypothetical protein n=1 Tax=Paenibacillus sp. TAB 01 TaxID=3368988 RepID=UPI003751E2C5
MQHLGTTVGMTVLIGFILYRRFKRTVGFQKLTRSRFWFRIVLFSLVGCIFLYLGFLHPSNLIADGIGLLCGLVLSHLAVKHTQLEKREDGWYYSTHLGVQIAVLLLLVARVGYKVLTMYTMSPEAIAAANADPAQQFTKDPLTAGIFFVMVSFYIRFFLHLLGETKKLEAELSPDRPEL